MSPRAMTWEKDNRDPVDLERWERAIQDARRRIMARPERLKILNLHQSRAALEEARGDLAAAQELDLHAECTALLASIGTRLHKLENDEAERVKRLGEREQ